jgi:hypothetical protein
LILIFPRILIVIIHRLPPWLFFTMIFVGLISSAAITVYNDALKRGLNKREAYSWAWSTYALFFGGIIWLFKRPPIAENTCIDCKGVYFGNPQCCPRCGHINEIGIVELSDSGDG